MRTAIVLILVLPLQGCFFFFIPGSLMGAASDKISGDFGTRCIPDTAKVGDSFKTAEGQPVKVSRISGPSTRCQVAGFPIRADVIPD